MTAMVLAIMPSIVLFVFLQNTLLKRYRRGGERLIVVLKNI